MDNLYHIIWEKRRKEEKERPYLQIPLPIPPQHEKKPPNSQKDKEKRGIYIFQM